MMTVFSPRAVAQPNFAALTVSFTNAVRGVTVGQYFTCTERLYNNGWEYATNTVVTNRLPAGLQLISATPSGWSATVVTNGGLIIWTLGDFAPYHPAALTMEFKSVTEGFYTNTAMATSDTPDSNPTNRQAVLTAVVTRARFFAVGQPHTYYDQPSVTSLPNNKALVVGSPLTHIADVYNASTRVFELAGSLQSMHLYHTATMMNNGQVLIVGGIYAPWIPELFDPSTYQFTPTAGTTYAPRINHEATLLDDGRVLLCGNAYPPLTNEVYDPTTGLFSLAPDLQCAPTGTLLPNGKYLTVFAYNASLYDPVTGTTAPTGTPNYARGYQTTTLLPGGRVLVAGGRIFNTSEDGSTSAEIYDVTTGKFTPTASMNVPRRDAGACVLPDGTVLIASGMGGFSGPGLTNAEIFDPNGTLDVPGVGASDAAIIEGDFGTTNWIQFAVWLTTTSALPVTVDFATMDGSASTFPGEHSPDFVGTNGTLIFAPGQTNIIISVPIIGDNVREPNETFTLGLSNVTQAWMARTVATGTIIDNDPFPSVSIAPAAMPERDTGLSNLLFNVTLSAPSIPPVAVDYLTSDGTAEACQDYVATSGTLVFNPGETNKTIAVPVIGDLNVEPDEFFQITMANPTNATISVAQATGTILNDDGFAGKVHHLDIAPIGGAQLQCVGFPVSITAKDIFSNVVTSFSGPVLLALVTTNVLAANLDFDGPSLVPWTTFNYTPYDDRSFQQVTYDVEGLGVPSTALRTIAGGGSNGIVQNIYLTGGIAYTFTVHFVNAMEGDDMSWNGAAVYLGVGPTNSAIDLPGGRPGTIIRLSGSLIYTPPTNGVYPLQITISRDWYWGDALAVYMDDVQISYPVISPAVVTNNFTNGFWTGTVASLQAATNVALLANDMLGHKGVSNPFYVQAATDLGLTMTSRVQVTPPLRTGMRQLFDLAVTNRGPNDAPGVVVHGTWPSNLTLVAVTNAQGSFSNFIGGADWLLPSVMTGSNYSAVLVYRADIPGDFTNQFTAFSPMPEVNPVDNLVAVSDHVDPPLLNISDASGTEANAATTGMVFSVTLSGPSAQTIWVDYFTADGTASNGLAYHATNGTLSFAPGITNTFITVYAIDDILDEPDRTFTVLLTNAVNAIVSDGSGKGTVVDDDPPPAITIADTSVLEGDSGATNAVFQLTMNKPAIVDVAVHCATATNTAAANDFVSTSGTVVIPAGMTNATFAVPVIGNTVNEPDETFFVNLSQPSNATIARAQAVGTILNDDAVPGRLDHFIWGVVPPQNYSTLPFSVSLRAVDYQGNPASNGVSSAVVIARTENGLTNWLQSDFEDGNTNGWANSGSFLTAMTTNETAAQGSNSLRLGGFTSVFGAGLRHALSNSQPDKIRFSVRTASTNQQSILYAFDRGANCSVAFQLGNKGQMGLLDGQHVLHGVPYQSNRWYQVDVTINWALQNVDCSIDGTTILTNIPCPTYPVTNVNSLTIANNSATTTWWDNVQVINDNLTNTFAVTPSNFVAFVNCTVTNTIAINGVGTNVYLHADDGLEHVGASGLFNLPQVKLTLATPASMIEGSAPTNAQVYMPIAFPGAITVSLASSAPARLQLPSNVVIAANQTNANFSLGLVDDNIPNWTVPVSIIASGTNVAAATNAITLIDNDPAPSFPQVGTILDGRFQMALQGPPASNFVLIASSNLVDWEVISNLSFANGPLIFADPMSTNLARRFYRLAPAP